MKRVYFFAIFTFLYSQTALSLYNRSKLFIDVDLGYGRFSQKNLDVYQTDLTGPIFGIGLLRKLSPKLYAGISASAHLFKQSVIIDGREDQLKQQNYVLALYGKRFFSTVGRFFIIGKINYSLKRYSLDSPILEEVEPAAKTVYGVENGSELGISYGMGMKLLKLGRRPPSYLELKFYRTDYLSTKSNDLALTIGYIRSI